MKKVLVNKGVGEGGDPRELTWMVTSRLTCDRLREQLQWPKLNFGEVVYRLSPGYYPFGDYCASMFCAWFVMKVYFLAEICM